jgi:integrase
MKAKITLITVVDRKQIVVEFRKGQPVAVPGAGTYYARYSMDGKRVVQSLGDNLAVAVPQFRNIELARECQKRNLPVPTGLLLPEPALPESDDPTIATRIDKYLDQIDRQVANDGKTHGTYKSYRYGLTLFQEFCQPLKITTLGQLTPDHMLDFQAFMRKAKKLSKRTVFNCFNTVMIFFKWADNFKVPDLKSGDRPVMFKRKVEEYSDEELGLFLQHAKHDERLVIQCFLYSGLRTGELQHLTYGDIEFTNNILHVEPKPEWNWKPKKNKSREVPIPDFLTAELKERMQKWDRRGKDLVFFNRDRRPDGKLLRHVKRVAKRAKVTGRVDDHKFRSTAITRWLQAGYTVQDVMGFVGHDHPDTIMLYAARVNLRKPETRNKINAVWEQFAPKPTLVPARRTGSGD